MQELLNLLEEIGLPYYRQGSISDKDYPPSFFTFWNVETPEDMFYDNEGQRFVEYIQVCFYTNDANIIYSGMDNFVMKAKEKGFVVHGRPNDVGSGRKDYFGRVCYIRIIHKGE